MVVTNVRDPGNPAMTAIGKFFGSELRSRYVNLIWIAGMKKEGYAGAAEICTGTPLGSAERVTQTGAWSLVPAIRPWRDRFALAWTEYRPASSWLHDGTGEVDFAVVG
jgi:hypothetical protein